jgi:hypothetical protein
MLKTTGTVAEAALTVRTGAAPPPVRITKHLPLTEIGR